MSSPAARLQRNYRRRIASGKIVLHIEVNEVDLTELLIAANLLAPLQDHGRGDLERALEQGVERLIEILAR